MSDAETALVNFKQKKVSFGTKTFLLNGIGGLDGIKLMNKLTSIYAPIYAAGGNIELGNAIKQAFDNPEFLEVQEKLLQSVFCNNQMVNMDMFTCNYDMYIWLLKEVIEFNFSSGFKYLVSDGRALLGMTTP